jgi:hypothetical protein
MSLPGSGGGAGVGGASSGSGGMSVPKLKSGERQRTEFIIVLYWVEPLTTEPDPKQGYAGANAEGGYGDAGASGYPSGYGNYPSGYGGGPPTGSGGGRPAADE